MTNQAQTIKEGDKVTIVATIIPSVYGLHVNGEFRGMISDKEAKRIALRFKKILT